MAQTILRASRARGVVREPLVEAPGEPDRTTATTHYDATVVRRAEVVEEHPSVDDRLATRPADLGEQLGHRFGEHDVRPEVRHVPAHGTPAARGGIHRHDDLPCTDAPMRGDDDAVSDLTR